MEDININVLVDAKNEYMMQLTNTITPHIYTGALSKIYNKAVKQCDPDEDITPTFKRLLKEVPKWNQDVIADITKYVVEKSQCDWLDDLLTAVFISNARILTAVRTQTPKDKRLNLTIPTTEHFIHHCYIEVAREMYKNPYLFTTDDMSNSDRHRNLRDTLDLIKVCVGQAVRKLLPVQTILKQYLGHLHDDDDISVISEKPSIKSKLSKKQKEENKEEDKDESSDEESVSDQDTEQEVDNTEEDKDTEADKNVDQDADQDTEADKDTEADTDQDAEADTDQDTEADTDQDTEKDQDTDVDDDIDLITVDEVEDSSYMSEDNTNDNTNQTDLSDAESSQFDVDSVITEESGDYFSDTTPVVEKDDKVEIKNVNIDDQTDNKINREVFNKSGKETLDTNDVIVEKSNSVVATPPLRPTTPTLRPTTPPLRSVSPTVNLPPTQNLSNRNPPKLPVPPLSRSIGVNEMETPILKEKPLVNTPRISNEPEIKVISDGKVDNNQREEDKKEQREQREQREQSEQRDQREEEKREVRVEIQKPLVKVPEPHTPVKVENRESREERRRRKKERRIRELRERGIVVRKPLRKDMKKKLKLKNLKRLPTEFDAEPKKPKPFVDRPSSPPTPQGTELFNSRPVFFNDAETRMSDGSDNE